MERNMGFMYNIQNPKSKLYHKGTRVPFLKKEQSVQMLAELIDLFTPRDGLVVDFYGGSLTLAIAAMSCGRRCICIEKNMECYNEAVERLRKHLPSSLKNQEGTTFSGRTEETIHAGNCEGQVDEFERRTEEHAGHRVQGNPEQEKNDKPEADTEPSHPRLQQKENEKDNNSLILNTLSNKTEKNSDSTSEGLNLQLSKINNIDEDTLPNQNVESTSTEKTKLISEVHLLLNVSQGKTNSGDEKCKSKENSTTNLTEKSTVVIINVNH